MTGMPRRAVVTGSSSGIGLAIARTLLAQQWQVHGLDIAPPAIAQDGFVAVRIDLCDDAAIAAAAQTAVGAAALVHAAGVLRVAPLGALDSADAELMWRLHVASASQLANLLVPPMVRPRSGGVVLVASRTARVIGGCSQYAATKAAMISLARSWAAEVAGAGVTVNVVSPAATRTAMLDDPWRAGSPPRLPPMGRLIEPQDVASLVAYLLSPAAAAITGQDIRVCGGASLEH